MLVLVVVVAGVVFFCFIVFSGMSAVRTMPGRHELTTSETSGRNLRRTEFHCGSNF